MDNLIERIKKIEALIIGAQTEGERNAAISAKQRILDKYPGIDIHRDPIEYRLSTSDLWHKKLLIALCRKYGISPYRYYRQKHTTVMVRVNEDFLNRILWPEYLEYSDHLEKLVSEITDELIGKIHDIKEEDVIRGKLS